MPRKKKCASEAQSHRGSGACGDESHRGSGASAAQSPSGSGARAACISPVNDNPEEWERRAAKRAGILEALREEFPRATRGVTPNPYDRELSKRTWERLCMVYRNRLKDGHSRVWARLAFR